VERDFVELEDRGVFCFMADLLLIEELEEDVLAFDAVEVRLLLTEDRWLG
jgi:hypothetical protein